MSSWARIETCPKKVGHVSSRESSFLTTYSGRLLLRPSPAPPSNARSYLPGAVVICNDLRATGYDNSQQAASWPREQSEQGTSPRQPPHFPPAFSPSFDGRSRSPDLTPKALNGRDKMREPHQTARTLPPAGSPGRMRRSHPGPVVSCNPIPFHHGEDVPCRNNSSRVLATSQPPV